MLLARVEGSVVATKKDAGMSGRRLLLLRPQLVDEGQSQFRPGPNTVVAVDTVGAGVGELVMFCQGSSARLAAGFADLPVDAVVVGIVDVVDALGHELYNSRTMA